MAQTGHATSRRRWLEAQVKTGEAPVYRYHFELPAPVDKFHPAGSGAFHSDDIEYVFGTLDSREGAQWRPEDRALSDLIGQYWTTSRVPAIRTVQPQRKSIPAEVARIQCCRRLAGHATQRYFYIQTRHSTRSLSLPRYGMGEAKKLNP
jgi:hypothetical protein